MAESYSKDPLVDVAWMDAEKNLLADVKVRFLPARFQLPIPPTPTVNILMPVVLFFPSLPKEGEEGSTGGRVAIRFPMEEFPLDEMAPGMGTFVETLVGRARLAEMEDGSVHFRVSEEA